MRGSGELRDDTENSDESVSIKAGAVQGDVRFGLGYGIGAPLREAILDLRQT
jgi:hypothetical protein